MPYKDDQKWQIPEKFRASIDTSDEAAYARLLENDAAQRELAARVAAPFIPNTPLERAITKARVTIQTLEPLRKLTADQREQLAEAYAHIGRYDLAAGTSRQRQKEYRAIWNAVWREDAEWCAHPAQHRFVKDHIWSVKHAKEMPLLKCNVQKCGCLNVGELPADIADRSAGRKSIRGATRGMTIQEALAWHNANVKRSGTR